MNNPLKKKLLLRYFSSIEYMEEMVDAHRKAIVYTHRAIVEFNNNPPTNWEEWPIWDSPNIWSLRVLPNFEATQHSMESALKDAHSGNLKGMRYLTESMRGISKSMDGIGWKWWAYVKPSTQELFGNNFEKVKQHSENIYWTLCEGWNRDEILDEDITGKIDDKNLFDYLKPGESIE